MDDDSMPSVLNCEGMVMSLVRDFCHWNVLSATARACMMAARALSAVEVVHRTSAKCGLWSDMMKPSGVQRFPSSA